MKKLIALLTMVTICMGMMIFPAMAAEDYPETGFDFEAFEAQERLNGTPKVERLKYTASSAQDLEISNKKATASASITGYKGTTTKIVIYMYIQQLKNGSWTTLDSHRYEFSNWYADKEITYSPCPHKYTYRLKCSYYVYAGSKYESFADTSAEYVYK